MGKMASTLHDIQEPQQESAEQKKRGVKKGFRRSEETRRKMSAAKKGHPVSEETRRKMSEARKGKPHRKGYHFSEDARRKMSEALKGHSISEEQRRKTSEAMKGHPVSEETRRKMRGPRKKRKISSALSKNKPVRKNNTSGHIGVSFYAARGKWVASITFKGERIHLGSHPTQKEAVAARKEAEKKYIDPAKNEYIKEKTKKSESSKASSAWRNTKPLSKNNTSGYPGVFLTHSGKWGARITHEKIVYNLGVSDNKGDAIKARKNAEANFDLQREKEIIGQKFGRLTVIKRTAKRTSEEAAYLYKCKCDCGKTVYTMLSNLKLGKTKSCGCFRRDRMKLILKQRKSKEEKKKANVEILRNHGRYY
jgi:hypothetical protein